MDELPSECRNVGHYHILSLIGSGGMGAVYLAEHEVIGRRAVIKFLHPEVATDSLMVERFFNEARAVNRVRHRGIVDIFDCGHAPDGRPYLAMELLEGESLAARLRRDDRLSLAASTEIVVQIADAVAAAHRAGIVHRDLKPDNIFLTLDEERRPIVKVLDFGIAQLAADPVARLTQTLQVFGTPFYMSPEQCASAKHVDQRADIYSLGVIIYEMLCGQPPFVAEGVGRILAMHQYEEPRKPALSNPVVTPRLEAVILKALAKSPQARFQSMGDFKGALQAATSEADATRPAIAPPEASVPPTLRHLAATAPRAVAPTLREALSAEPPAPAVVERPQRVLRRLLIQLPIGLGVAAVAIGAFWLVSGRSHEVTVTNVRRDLLTGSQGGKRALATSTEVRGGVIDVPAGTFFQGWPKGQGATDEWPQRSIYLAAFQIDTYEVSVAQYRKCVEAGKCSDDDLQWPAGVSPQVTGCNFGQADRDDHPINCVSWEQARSYCAWAGKRLPTEAEWEKAARGTDGREYPWGNAAATCERAVMDDGTAGKSAGCGKDRTWPVGSKPLGRSAYGVQDMAGNVSEWVSDWYDKDYYGKSPARNPQGPSLGTERVIRGGSWPSSADAIRAAHRFSGPPKVRSRILGFRCVRTTQP